MPMIVMSRGAVQKMACMGYWIEPMCCKESGRHLEFGSEDLYKVLGEPFEHEHAPMHGSVGVPISIDIASEVARC